MTEQQMIQKHIEECQVRICNIRGFMETSKDADIKECENNISILEAVIDCLKKQMPKQPDLEGDGYDPDGNLVYDTWICPNCEKHYEVDYENYDYCPNCGQKIDCSNDLGEQHER